MKIIMKSVAVAGVTMLAVTMLAKDNGLPLHTIRFTYKVVFTNTGAQSTAAGTATASESINDQNQSDKETLTVSLKGLNANDSYSLIASGTSAGSNFVDDVDDFSPSRNGSAKLALKNTGNTKHPALLTGPVDPLFDITELDVVDNGDFSAGVTNNPPLTILTADTVTPGTYTFQDKEFETSSNSTTSGASGTVTVSASNKSAKVSLTATGLLDSTQYVLTFNGTPAATNNTFTSTSRGTLKINAPISVPVLDLTDVDLDDTATPPNNVLFFPIP